jgi:hypothetical protein
MEKQKRQGRYNPAEEIQEFVRGHHRAVTGKPADGGNEHDGRGKTRGNGFERQGVSVAKISKDGHALVVESGADPGRY